VDAGDHTLKKFSSNGKLLLTIGTPGKSSGRMSGLPFSHPTHAAISPVNGNIFISDGYSNAAVHKFSPNGKHLLSWGKSGTDPGEFNTVHNISIDDEDWVYIADRENHRIQVFDSNGKYQSQWVNLAMASCIVIQNKPEKLFYVGEFFAGIRESPSGLGNWTGKRLGPRISVLNPAGNIVARIGNLPIGLSAGEFVAPHGISLDSKGNIYLGEVSWQAYGNNFDPPQKVRTIQKLTKI
jgi:DNA-binding beta-propeller fold protein YncE